MSANVDQKRVLKFGSLADFNAVSSTLEYPGLFMIGDTTRSDEDGTSINRNAIRASIDKASDAEIGDILLVSVDNNKMICVTCEGYNLQDYPFNQYKPIAVCINDKTHHTLGHTVFLSVQYLGISALGSGFADPEGVKVAPVIQIGGKIQSAQELYNTYTTKEINDQIRAITTRNYNVNSLPPYVSGEECPAGYYDAFGLCWRFSTPGTKEGDWMLPSSTDVYQYCRDETIPNDSFKKIHDLLGNDYLGGSYAGWIWVARQRTDSTEFLRLKGTLGETDFFDVSFTSSVRAVFIPQLVSD